MFMMERDSANLLKIENVEALWDPFESQLIARSQAGEEEQPSSPVDKSNLVFPSGEELPECWINPNFGKSR